MSKKSKIIVMLIALITGFTSCEKEENIVPNEQTLSHSETNVYVENDYLVFDSKESLDIELKALQHGKNDFINKLKVKKNFNSLKNSNKDQLILKSGLSGDENLGEPDADDELVKDPYLQEVLNEEREIVVDGKLYKITEYGVLRTDPENQNELDRFIDSNPDFSSIENDKSVDEFIEVDSNIELLLPKETFTTSLQPQYIMPDPDEGGGGSSGGSSGGSNTSDFDPLTGLMKRVTERADMNICDEGDKTWAGEQLAGMLGYSVNCKNYFTEHRRVKTVFWAQNFWFINSIGVKVKMQKQHTGIWWARDAQKLELGWDYVQYNVKIDMQPKYMSIQLSPDVFNTQFQNVRWYNVLKDIADEFKLDNGRFPTGLDMHNKMCEKNFKEWTLRSTPGYGDFADLNVYIKKQQLDNFWLQIVKAGGKPSLKFIAEFLQDEFGKNPASSPYEPSMNEIIEGFKNGPANKSITFIDEDLKLTRLVFPREAALSVSNDNKIEYLLDSSKGAIGGGVSLNGGKALYSADFYKAPAEFDLVKGSTAYGVAQYYDAWKGSFIRKVKD